MNPSNYIREGLQVARTFVPKSIKPQTKAFGVSTNTYDVSHYPQQTVPVQYPMVYQPAVMIPYGTPYFYATVPYFQAVTYQPISYGFHKPAPKFQKKGKKTTIESTSEFTQEEEVLTNTVDTESESADNQISVQELCFRINNTINLYGSCPLSFFHRMVSKCATPEDFHEALQTLNVIGDAGIQTTSETGTLLIKAACRAGLPEEALAMVQQYHDTRLNPGIAGIHYLMINLSLKKNTQGVMDAYQVIQARGLKPCARTFHIIIRECIDNDLVHEAMYFAEEAKRQNIIPNRVTYNILMNGYRKHHMAHDILALRSEMDAANIEINDTTVKFTALAYMMLGDKEKAVQAFLEYPAINEKIVNSADKFLEGTEDAEQQKMVLELLDAVKERQQ